jgi:hypothetical protein
MGQQAQCIVPGEMILNTDLRPARGTKIASATEGSPQISWCREGAQGDLAVMHTP